MVQESAQTFSLVMVTVAVLLQTIFLIAIALSVAKMRKALEQFTADVRKFLETTGRSVEILNVRLTQISQTVQNRLLQADHMTDELLARSRVHALALDKLIKDFLHTAEYALHEVEQIARSSFREVHAVNAGFQAALGHLFARRKSETNRQRGSGVKN